MSALGDILCDSWGVVLATFGSFLGHRLIFHVDFMAICEGIELVVQLGHSVVEIESDSATMVSWILSRAHVCRDYTDALHHIRALVSSYTILVSHMLRKATSVVGYLTT